MYPPELQQSITLPDGTRRSLGQLLEQAIGLHQNGRLSEAQHSYQLILQELPGQPHALHFLGVMHHQQGQHGEAEKLIRKSLAHAPDNPDALCNLGAVLNALGRHEEAADLFRSALDLEPGIPNALNGLGSASFQLGQVSEARAMFEKAIAASPDFAEAHNNLSMCLLALHDAQAAEQASLKALQVAPGHPGCLAQLAEVFRVEGRIDEAIAIYRSVVQAVPGIADYWYNLGQLQDSARQWDAAHGSYQNALQIDRLHGPTLSAALFLKRAMFDWDGLEALSQTYFEALEKGVKGLTPFSFMLEDSTPAQQRQCAELWVSHHFSRIEPMADEPDAGRKGDDRIVLAYLSSDFCQHPTSYLMAGVFEAHDRERFRLLAYSSSPDDSSEIRQRIIDACDEFIEIGGLTPAQVAGRIRADRVDVLVDRKGYTLNALTEVFALRPAPMQVNYVGYPGTMGAAFIDCLVADDIVIPPGQESAYSEKIVRLPDSYFPTGRHREQPLPPPSRSECGLPDDAFIFCCFNNSQKITPATFDRWIRILNDVPGSVLWLLDPAVGGTAKDKLYRQARTRGLDPGRVLFAHRRPHAEYEALYSIADLFLDTLPYNAHTTACDAMWMACPVLTLPGETFVSRVGASLARAAGMSEMVMASIDEYHATAIRLATDRDELDALKEKLRAQRDQCALFDSQRYTRNLEQALLKMIEDREL